MYRNYHIEIAQNPHKIYIKETKYFPSSSQFSKVTLLCLTKDIIYNNTKIAKWRQVRKKQTFQKRIWFRPKFEEFCKLLQNLQTISDSHSWVEIEIKFQEFCKIMEERSRELDLELGYKVFKKYSKILRYFRTWIQGV